MIWFYGTSTSVGYLTPNPVFIHKILFIKNFIYQIYMICKHIFKWAWSHFFCTQLNGFKYCYLTLIILFDITHLFAHSEVVASIAI